MKKGTETLEQRVMALIGEDANVPISVKTRLSYCSKKLERVQTEEEFDAILDQYVSLKGSLKRVGLQYSDFKKIINDMKKEL